ncbi:cytochrome c [Gimesia panareensis]|uniref:Cytochrome c n=1 Tax=Gimesia panareensis TaxID=2527978 RepID=A0A518FMJ6_9PLAN|nr:cytochrome c [Gimesia panareensis]QDT26342.1 hypothetical protein Enr10x_16430 [Gimesia panareensis]QDU49279.1 hypothetical protein Pan110_15980 [Gimesia panareensis]QDV17485.1 hypothetical protein Pan153_21380 [Gimesia panareensis]
MRNLHHKQFVGSVALLGLAIALIWSQSTPTLAGSDAKKTQAGVPVEPDMHEFMEYVFQPTYKRLKQAIAAEPDNRKVWKAIKSDALILAEGGNLLLLHDPQNDRSSWNEYSQDVRKEGGLLYKAAKSKDFKTARKHYVAMLKNCNACHQKFADGEHQLTP